MRIIIKKDVKSNSYASSLAQELIFDLERFVWVVGFVVVAVVFERSFVAVAADFVDLEWRIFFIDNQQWDINQREPLVFSLQRKLTLTNISIRNILNWFWKNLISKSLPQNVIQYFKAPLRALVLFSMDMYYFLLLLDVRFITKISSSKKIFKQNLTRSYSASLFADSSDFVVVVVGKQGL